MFSSIPFPLAKGIIPAYRHIHDSQRLIYLEGRGNYTLIYLADSPSPLLVSKTLKYFESMLPTFVRLNKSVLINPGFVERVGKENSNRVWVELSTGCHFLVSRRRIGPVLDQLREAAESS